jgi:hypothetical protein
MATTVKTEPNFQEFIFTNATYDDLHVRESKEAKPKYYVDSSTFTPGKPDLTVHVGDSKTGPIAGVCKVGHSMEKKIGLGDPSTDLNSVQWESLKQQGRYVNIQFRFVCESGPDGERKTFAWTRVSRYPEHYKLFMEGHPSELLAEYSSSGWLGKFGKDNERGRVSIIRGKGENWEQTVLLTILTMLETTKRRTRRNM